MRSLAGAVGLLIAAAVIGLAAGSAAPAPSGRVSHYRHWGVSFTYPSAWKRLNWCWEGVTETPLVMLTKASTPPTCDNKTTWGIEPRLRRDGMAVWWEEGGAPGVTWDAWVRHRPTTHIGGQPARSAVFEPNSRSWRTTGCDRRDVAMITEVLSPHAADNSYLVRACVRGPRFAADERAVRKMLASVHFYVQK